MIDARPEQPVDAERSPGYMTEERRMIKEAARDFTMNEVLPVANELDPVQGDIPESLRKKMGEMGYFGITIPEQYGGLGLGCFEYCLVAEELARGWMSVASLIARGNGFYRAIPGSGKVREDRIRAMAQGEYLGAMAISEPNVGSDMSSISCRAKLDGHEWVINGQKYWCTFADGADFINVVCRVDDGDEASGRPSLKAIAVPKEKGSFPDGIQGSPIPKIGYFGWRTFELSFSDVRVPVDRDPSAGGGFASLASGLEAARAHTAARSIGLAQGAYEDAVAYAQERVQFGQPISDFQAIRFKIANMATEIEAARQLNYFVCNEIDLGRRCDKESSMVKYFASEMAERVASDALQVLGGAGYTKLHAVERHWRDARLTKIFEGTSEIQQRIISDRILGKPTRR